MRFRKRLNPTLATKEELDEHMGLINGAQSKARKKIVEYYLDFYGREPDREWHDGLTNAYHIRYGDTFFVIEEDGHVNVSASREEQNPISYSEAWQIHNELSEAGDNAFGTRVQKLRFINRLRDALRTLPESKERGKIAYLVYRAEQNIDQDNWLTGTFLTQALSYLHGLLVVLVRDDEEW